MTTRDSDESLVSWFSRKSAGVGIVARRNPFGSFLRGPAARPKRRWDRSLTITLISGLLLLVVISLIFAVAYGSQRITAGATSLHDADESLRSATVARAQLAMAGHMAAVDEETGSSSVQFIAFSIAEAEQALAELDEGLALLEAGDLLGPEEMAAADNFRQVSADAIAHITSGREDVRSVQDPLQDSFDALVEELLDVRNMLFSTVASSDQLLGQVGNVARFFVAFLVPGAVILIYRELSKRQQRQSELETRLEAERQLNLAQEQFIANASHELRTPLTSIMGMSMMLAEEDEVRDSPRIAELVRYIVGESEELARMVEDLLTVARLDAGALTYSFEDFSVAEELRDMTGSLTRNGVAVGVTAGDAVIRADRLRFRQVVRNLLSNARKYGGTNIRVEGRIDGRTYLCSVIDDGTGVPEELVPRLFQRFIHQGQETASKESVGLGLSIVHSLAMGMGGSITYDRLKGETHFSLRLPLEGAHALDDGEPAQPMSHAVA